MLNNGFIRLPARSDRLVKVGRPLEAPPPATLPRTLCGGRSVFDRTALLGRSLPRRARDWTAGSTLKARLEQYADAINKCVPGRGWRL